MGSDGISRYIISILYTKTKLIYIKQAYQLTYTHGKSRVCIFSTEQGQSGRVGGQSEV